MFDIDEDQEFKDNVIDYICGFVVKKLKKKMNCQNCINSLFGQTKPGLISIRQMDVQVLKRKVQETDVPVLVSMCLGITY